IASALRPTMSFGRPGRCTSPAEIAVVTPPFIIESMKSMVRWRGVKSPKTGWTCESMSPGRTVVARASITVSASPSRPRPTAAIRPSRIRIESASRSGRRMSPLASAPMLRTSVVATRRSARDTRADPPIELAQDGGDVRLHPGARLRPVAGGDRVEDPPMVDRDLGALGAALLEARRHDLALEVHEDARDDGVHGVARGVGQEPVELHVEGAGPLRRGARALLEALGECLDVGVG